MNLYKNIKELREQNGWTQAELAKRAGYNDRSMITKIEKGHVDLSESKIKLFSEIFGVSPVELMGIETEFISTEETQNRQIRRLIEYAKKLSESDLEMICGIAERMTEKR